MKTRNILLILIATFFGTQGLMADVVPVKGEWDNNGGNRSISSLPPTVYIENSTIILEYRSFLEDLTVCILDESGEIIEENLLILGNSGERFRIPLTGKTGVYEVVLIHKRGRLAGSFKIY